jgi:hypothetical protein
MALEPSFDDAKLAKELKDFYQSEGVKAYVSKDSAGLWRLQVIRTRAKAPFGDLLAGLPIPAGVVTVDRAAPSLLAIAVDGTTVGYLARGDGVMAIPAGFDGGVDWLLDALGASPPEFPALASLRFLELRSSPGGKKLRDMAIITGSARPREIALSGPIDKFDLRLLAALGPSHIDLRFDRFMVLRITRASGPLSNATTDWRVLGRPSYDGDRYLAVARALYPDFNPQGDLTKGLTVKDDDYEENGVMNTSQYEKGRFGDDRYGFTVDLSYYSRSGYFVGLGEPESRFVVDAYGLPEGWKLALRDKKPAMEMVGAPGGVAAAIEQLRQAAVPSCS